MGKIQAERYHDICCGHRVYGHESKCANLHGHNYRFHFTVEAAELDSIGRVIDFSVIKSIFCDWLEENWDHKFLLWVEDPIWDFVRIRKPYQDRATLADEFEGFIKVPFNPTAENIAEYFVESVAPLLLFENNVKGVELVKLKIEETRKCSAIYIKK